jgi:ATP-binding cassette subfamily B protein
LLAFEPGAGAWTDFALAVGQSLKLSDHGGLAFLELFDASRRLARWRFTLACNPAAVRLSTSSASSSRAGETVREEETEGEDFDFGESSAPPSTWVLLRLWRFARPYQGSCCWALR